MRGISAFAYYLSRSAAVADAAQEMWKVSVGTQALVKGIGHSCAQDVDWTYIFYGLGYQLTAILLATSPRWYLYQALGSNLLWMLPWAIVVTKISFPHSPSWTYYAIIFGGANVFNFIDASLVDFIWLYRLEGGKVKAATNS